MSKKDIRNKFRNDVLKRDNYKCAVCGDSISKLDAHHIIDRKDMISGGYVKENGIALCDRLNGCHIKAEKYHISDGKEYELGYHPNDLFRIINSSYELALKKSQKL